MSLLQVLVLFFMLTISDSCHVLLLSWSGDNYTASYISVNRVERLNGETRGIYTLLINRQNCRTSDPRRFDTHASTQASNQLAAYVRSLRNGTTILGVSVGEVSRRLTVSAYDALTEIGVDMHGFGYMWKCNFVAVVGMPHWSVTRLRNDARYWERTTIEVTEREIILECVVALRSWSWADPVGTRHGYIHVGSETRLATNQARHHRGIYTMILNRRNCATTDPRRFDTHVFLDASNQLATYLRGLSDGTVIVGVTADSVVTRISNVAFNALREIGVNVPYRFGNKFAFVAAVGTPQSSVTKTGADGATNVAAEVAVTGTGVEELQQLR